MQLDRDAPPGRYVVVATEGLFVGDCNGRVVTVRSANRAAATEWEGWVLSLPEPLTVGSTAIWTNTPNEIGGRRLIRLGSVVSIERVGLGDQPPPEIASLLVEMRAAFRAMGHPLTDESFDTTARYALGEITHDEMMEIITNRARGVRPVAHLPAPTEKQLSWRAPRSGSRRSTSR